MEKEIFEKEIAICQKLSRENGGRCNWGECAKCGVIPLLYKLHKGKLYEEKKEIDELKSEVLE